MPDPIVFKGIVGKNISIAIKGRTTEDNAYRFANIDPDYKYTITIEKEEG